MFGLILDAVRAVWAAITRTKNLAAENVALRHQLDVVLRPTRSRPRLKLAIRDRILWVWLSRIWSGWKDAVRIVKPETVIAWHRRGWGLYWTWRSKRRGLIRYRDEEIGRHRMDLVVEEAVVVELKAVPQLAAAHYDQLRSYLRASGMAEHR